MNRTKKVLSGILAALMLVSMLAIFVLPAGAAETQTDYIVSTAADWNKLANDTGIDWTGKTIHIQNDISFASKNQAGEITSYIAPVQFGTFAGTLDGHGYKFTDIQMSGNTINSASLITLLTGTIQNLTLDSTCIFTNTYSGVKSGAFAAESNGGIIYNCASYATYNATMGDHLGGFVGTANHGVTIDGCFFAGTVISEKNGAANAFVGYNNGARLKIYNSIAMGTLKSGDETNKAPETGMIRIHATMAGREDIIYNSYAIGINVCGYNVYNTTLDEAKAAKIQEAYSKETHIEAAWQVNEGYTAQNSCGEEQVYFSVDHKGKLCFGDGENRVVRLTTFKPNSTTPTYSYYGPRYAAKYEVTNTDGTKSLATYSTVAQTEIIPETFEGYTAVVSGAQYGEGTVWPEVGKKYTGKVIYVGNSNIELRYVPTATYELQQAKKQLQELVAAYGAMNHDYFSNWDAKQAWLNNAKAVLENESATTQDLKNQITAEGNLADGLVAMEYSNYPSISEYNTYKSIASMKHYTVGSKADWLKAIDLTNFVENPDAVDLKGITLHLIADIDMGKTAMLPLAYGGIFDGMLDGHDHVFQNINIEINSPYGPVGLIGVIGKTIAGSVQNVGVESGDVYVYGAPRYKAMMMQITDGSNKGGVIVGKNNANYTLIRKCWNNADIKVSNRDSAAGIIGDPRNHAIVDSCLNLGKSNGHGLLGYGRSVSKVYNSVSGIVGKSAALYAAGVTTNPGANIYNTVGVKSTLDVTNYSSDAATKAAQEAALAAYNAEDKNSALLDAEAAWKVNENYVPSGKGDRVYYTLNEDGEVRFGTAENQVRRIELVCGEEKQYVYVAAGGTAKLNFDVQANYYACADASVSIKDNIITVGDKNVTVYVGYDADRGNVNGDAAHTVNILDVLDALRMVSGSKAANKLTADVDNDYDVDVRDAYHMILYWINGGSKIFTPGLPQENKETDYLKVLSYNIKSFHYDPNTTSIYQNGEALCRTESVLNEIKMIDADIMGFQEVDIFAKNSNNKDELQMIIDALHEIHPETTYYKQFFMTVPSNKVGYSGGYGHGIVSKYEILGSGEVRFADKVQMAEDTPGKKLDAGEPRGFGWYKLDIDGNGEYDAAKDIIFYNCHLAEYTAPQLRYMTTYMKEHHSGDRIVCTGDFNLQAWEAEGAFDRDAFTVLNGGENFDSFMVTTDINGHMIDNILVSKNVEYFGGSMGKEALETQLNLYPLQDEDAASDGVVYTGKEWAASDHLPIWTYIKK